jgi:hypothetical protein
MKPETKLAIRRVAIRWARKLLDFLDERLHAEEMRLRDELELARLPIRVPLEPARAARPERATVSCPYPFPSDELLRNRIRGRIPSGGQPERAEKAQRRGCTAAAFDLRFSSQ